MTTQPSDLVLTEGAGGIFIAEATGNPTPSTQWQSSDDAGTTWQDIENGATSELAIQNAVLDESGTSYRAVFTNEHGQTISEIASLIVSPDTDITPDTDSAETAEGDTNDAIAEEGSPGDAEDVGSDAPTAEERPAPPSMSPFSVASLDEDITEVTGQPVVLLDPIDRELTADSEANAALRTANFSARTELTPAPTSAYWEIQEPESESWTRWEASTFSAAAAHFNTTLRIRFGETDVPPNGSQVRAVFANHAGETRTAAATLTVRVPRTASFDTPGPYITGQVVTISGSGFNPNSTVYVGPNMNSGASYADSTFSADSTGSFSGVEVTVPLWTSNVGASGVLVPGERRIQLREGSVIVDLPFTLAETEGATSPEFLENVSTSEVTIVQGESPNVSVRVAGEPSVDVRWINSASAAAPDEGNPNWTFDYGSRDGWTGETLSYNFANIFGVLYVRAVAATPAGLIVSDPVKITVLRATLPQITAHPTNLTVAPGGTVEFTAAAEALPAPTVQWQSRDASGDWTDLPGETQNNLRVTDVTPSDAGTSYRAVFTNRMGTAASNGAFLFVTTDTQQPAITTEPDDVTVVAGTSASFSADADGVPTPTVQWYSRQGDSGDWTIIAGGTAKTLVLTSTAEDLSGTQYRAVFTNIAGVAESRIVTLTVEPAGNDREYTSPTEPALRYTVPAVVEQGEDIVISGTGWMTNAGTGSIVAVLLDASFSGDPKAVFTTAEVINPRTGTASEDKRLHAIVQADGDGNWTARVPYPTPSTGYYGYQAGNPPILEWLPGTTHEIRFLTGSLGDNDKGRTLAATFTIGGDAPVGPTYPPSWEYEQVFVIDRASGNTAIAWVEKNVEAGDGQTIRIKGTGWMNKDGDGASTVALKLNYDDGQYTHSGSDIVQHPSASGDNTIWTLLAPSNPTSHSNVVAIAEDGNFEIEVPLPDGLTAGQMLSVLFQSGRFDSADITRAITTPFLVVDGVPYEVEEEEGDLPTCEPSTSSARVSLEETNVSLGGVLRVSGTGWCHPIESRGGSLIGIKIDDGAYSHLEPTMHSNLTVWAIVQADHKTGDWTAEIQLPDGTAATSTPAFPEGAHTLRLLTGSLKAQDEVRTLESVEFVVGAYRPNAIPYPLEAATALTNATKGGLGVVQSDTAITVTVRGAAEGDWVHLSAYAEDGSPRWPWGNTWFQTDAAGKVVAPLAGVTLPVGSPKLVAQSGNQGHVGELLGWGLLTVKAPPTTDTPVVPVNPQEPTKPVYTLAPRTSATPTPTALPDAPFEDGAGLTSDNAGSVRGVQDGTVVTITLPDSEPGDWVYLYAYSTPIPVGWIQVDADRQVKVDIAALPAGDHKIAVLDTEGQLIGWTNASITGAESTAPGSNDAGASVPLAETEAVVPPVGPGLLSAADWWLLGGGAVLVLLLVTAGLIVVRRRGSVALNEGNA